MTQSRRMPPSIRESFSEARGEIESTSPFNLAMQSERTAAHPTR